MAQWAWATLEGGGGVLVTRGVKEDGIRQVKRLLGPLALRDSLGGGCNPNAGCAGE